MAFAARQQRRCGAMIMKKRCAAILLILFALPLLRSPVHQVMAKEAEPVFSGSLLFSGSERQAIERALAVRPGDEEQQGAPGEARPVADSRPLWSVSRLHLSALIYTDPNNWTLWLGGRQVRPGSIPPFLRDVRVFAGYADISVLPFPGATPVPIRLRVHQTFLANQRRIVDDAGNTR